MYVLNNVKEYQHTFAPRAITGSIPSPPAETPKSLVTCSRGSLDINYLDI